MCTSTNDGPHNLRPNELEILADWFLFIMPMEQRCRLMADLPQTYAKLYPGVPAELITERVTDKIRAEKASRS